GVKWIELGDRKVEGEPNREVRLRCIADLLAPAADRLKHSTRKECPRLRHIHHAAEVHRKIERALNIRPRHTRFFVDQLYVAIDQTDCWVVRERLNCCFNSPAE